MSVHFSRSLSVLEGERNRRTYLVFILATGFLAMWVAWFLLGRVQVYASTATARVEADLENHSVDAAVGGRIETMPVRVGQQVHAGDILLEFDAVSERLARGEEQARLAPAASQVRLLQDQIIAAQRALEDDRRSAQATLEQAAVEADRASAAAAFAIEESKRTSELHRRGLISEIDALRGQNLAVQRQSDAEAAQLAARKSGRDLETREQDRLAQIARLRQEIAVLDGTRAEALAASEKLGYDIERRTVRAPIGGTIAEITPLTPGSVLRAGDRVCTIVPQGALRVVALFPPAMALGRVRAGQAARVRLVGFPWTQDGSPSAHVSSVAGEPRDGTIRVELTLDGQHDPGIPLQHGLPAEVDIEVDRLSPAALVMQSIGAYTRLTAAER